MNTKIKKIIIIIIIGILVLLNIAIFVKQQTINNKKQITNSSSTNSNISNEESENNSVQEQVSQMGERNRMQTYFGEFISEIEDKNYEKAYQMLNEKFKANYFDTEKKFEDYVKNKYPEQIAVKYTNIDRQGDLYVLTYEITSPFDSNYTKLTQRAVVKENGNNDFTISFQVL